MRISEFDPAYRECLDCGHRWPIPANVLFDYVATAKAREDWPTPPESMTDPAAAKRAEPRPPYSVAYSVAGIAYEVLLPGDATAHAEDGVLKISHPSAVLGIIRVAPVSAATEKEEAA